MTPPEARSASARIAIVGLACEYPDASSPGQLWENVLAQRRAFRALPDERMSRADYFSADRAAPDRTYCEMAAVIRGYEFDRVGFAIAGSTFRSTDLTHWLALDVAARALADAGFPGGVGLPVEATGVIVGNTLTGEFARANLMRLRWPYVRRTVAAALTDEGWDVERVEKFVAALEYRYKAPFPAVDEDTLVGGLSNTIAGRICNHFDLHGGGFTVDGACSSSLLAVATACSQLVDGGIDVALAGGVDLSIDPFEVVGFAKVGALTDTMMRVYDRRDSGFWPGEGAGMAVLMRDRDAAALGLSSYAVISGWGVSSDGRGGITRPELQGYRLAMRRAYQRSGYGPDSVSYFEGHSTGTPTGDQVELSAITAERRAADPDAQPAAIGSIKALIGHTKAACGVASLIKAVMAVRDGVIPPTAGCDDPHPVLTGERPALRMSPGEPWPHGRPRRAGVTSMGFGGINTHVVIEGTERARRPAARPDTAALLTSAQDEELLLFDASDVAGLATRLRESGHMVAGLSFAELTDLAAGLHDDYAARPARAAVVAGSPAQAAAGIESLLAALERGERRVLAPQDGVFAGCPATAPRIGLLFPGQGSAGDAGCDIGGAHRRRFPAVADLYRLASLPVGGDPTATELAQPRVITASLAGLRILRDLGIDGDVAVGHSVGELAALRWAGVFDDATVLRVTTLRGAAMASIGRRDGVMAGIAAPAEVVTPLLDGQPAVIAGLNGPRQTVVAGPAPAVGVVTTRAAQRGLQATPLRVSHAFHSPLVEPAAEVFGGQLAAEQLGAPARPVISTVTGQKLPADADLRALLRDQITGPVRFLEAVTAAAATGVDLFIEAGPGTVLSGLAAEATGLPALPLGTDGRSLGPLLRAVAAAVVLGAPVRLDALFGCRFARPLDRKAPLRFFASPCEAAPAFDELAAAGQPAPGQGAGGGPAGTGRREDTVGLLRRLAAERAELPADLVQPGSRLLDDLHLSSITVGQIMGQAARERGLSALTPATSFATATIEQLAQGLDDLAASAALGAGPRAGGPEGAASWVRPFVVEWAPARRPRPLSAGAGGRWTVLAAEGHPLAGPLRAALPEAGIGDGVALCLPDECHAGHVGLLLDAVRAALAGQGPRRFLVVGRGRGAAALAKTLHLEDPQVITCVVDAAPDVTAEDVVAEAAAATSFTEVRLDLSGARRIPLLRPFVPRPRFAPLTDDDVVLVTGGGKGITTECARALALDSGAALAILGRSDPDADPELAANLDRLGAAGVRFRYLRADITSSAQVARAIRAVRASFGEVTAIMHGAARNEPVALSALDEEHFRRTLAPKIDGLRVLLNTIDTERLRLLVAFGSIIGRVGLRGQADYATANEWLTDLTVEAGQELPGCRCLAIEWSVWSGVGMGERLGVVESLAREGITPISPDTGIELLRRLLGDPDSPSAVVVTGRLGDLPTVAIQPRELPLGRFTDKVVAHYPGIELITETDLTERDDPYLDDHRLDGVAILPGVLALEAMTQVATALNGQAGRPEWANVEFVRPIVVAPEAATTIRVAALAAEDGAVEVVIRSSETRFAAEHMRATSLPAATRRDGEQAVLAGQAAGTGTRAAATAPSVPLDPARDMYGALLFQGPRFQHLLGYRQLSSTNCLAEISGDDGEPWFAPTLPGRLAFGDPGPRDTFMHAIQACVPDATLLPTKIERLSPASGPWPRRMLLDARERLHDGDTYVYDLAVLDEDGQPIERWDGLRLHAVRHRGDEPWTAPLLAPFLMRRLAALLGTGPSAVAIEPEADGERDPAAERAAGRVLGRAVSMRHRPDGRPEAAGGGTAGPDRFEISLAHGPGLVFAVAGQAPLGCDVQQASATVRWPDVLTEPRLSLTKLVAAELAEAAAVAAARVWTATECLVKAGRPATDPLTFIEGPAPGWAVFSSGAARVATFSATLRGVGDPVIFAVLTGGRERR